MERLAGGGKRKKKRGPLRHGKLEGVNWRGTAALSTKHAF